MRRFIDGHFLTSETPHGLGAKKDGCFCRLFLNFYLTKIFHIFIDRRQIFGGGVAR